MAKPKSPERRKPVLKQRRAEEQRAADREEVRSVQLCGHGFLRAFSA
jgi:hypothetical protein